MIDSHCHLADPKFDDDIAETLQRAAVAGINRVVTIGDTIAESEKCVQIAQGFEDVFCTVGVHPHTSKDWKDGDEVTLKALVQSSPKVKAIGEIGLDYHYDLSPRDVQRDVFRKQLQLSKKLRLPVVVHCREAVEDVWSIVNEEKPVGLVLHCCTEKFDDVKRFLDAGYFLSFTGIATYKNGEVIRDCIKQCPLEQMMIETDAPYLAPVPHRGKRNEPAFVVEVAKLIAEVKGIGLQEVDDFTTKNAERFFKL